MMRYGFLGVSRVKTVGVIDFGGKAMITLVRVLTEWWFTDVEGLVDVLNSRSCLKHARLSLCIHNPWDDIFQIQFWYRWIM